MFAMELETVSKGTNNYFEICCFFFSFLLRIKALNEDCYVQDHYSQHGKYLLIFRTRQRSVLISCSSVPQGACQWVLLEFPVPVRMSELKLQFQGGFSGKTCKLEGLCQNPLNL